VPAGDVHTAATGRILHAADVHSVDADRNSVVGRVLDQQGLGAGAYRPRGDHGADDDHAVDHVSQ